MKPTIHAISHRLSLRKPQFESLQILERICELLPLSKDLDAQEALKTLQSEFQSVTSFEDRSFPSVCFDLATGVGKTRLMGAFITYLHLVKGVRHFFVLAPNLTIYNKLITDFQPNTPKYVFRGIAEFAVNPPEIITGDNYESGRGVREERRRQRSFAGMSSSPEDGPIHINIFNISKINSEVRGGKSPRIKRLHEYIGESYFEYLAGLPDLVLLMDEAHRYRASAGVRALNELKPILGLELTATPQVETGKGSRFQNVVYSYPLSAALQDGFVKIPAVATRENFNKSKYDEAGLEDLKLSDGVQVHENTKVKLQLYANENDKPVVKPFLLVVAQNVQHAGELEKKLSAENFFGGHYKGRTLVVHSNLSGDERDETVQQLLSVEDPQNPTEIVIHVNMLKEGWDVTNLYTIVPLRAANSKTLVEQSVGRGLRLPYGKRTGNPDVDRLTIVSHDRFEEIVNEANNPHSIIKGGVVIGRDIPETRSEVVQVESKLVSLIGGGEDPALPSPFKTPQERQVAQTALKVIESQARSLPVADLSSPEARKQIVASVQAEMTPAQAQLDGTAAPGPDVAAIVEKTVRLIADLSIEIPRITVVPKGEVTAHYRDFDLDMRDLPRLPETKDILVQHLTDNSRYRLHSRNGNKSEKRLEDYLVRGLVDYNDISYDDCAELLYKLAGQAVEHLRSYITDEEDLRIRLQSYQKSLVDYIHRQMGEHFEAKADEYEVIAHRGFHKLRPSAFSLAAGESARNFRAPVAEKSRIREMLFTGFSKCLYPQQKFDSDPERCFAVVLEDDPNVLKWIKPAKNDFHLYYNHEDKYEPDFVVEAKTGKWICEVKRSSGMEDKTVQAKASVARDWCRQATAVTGEKWEYALIPDNDIRMSMSFAALAEMQKVTA